MVVVVVEVMHGGGPLVSGWRGGGRGRGRARDGVKLVVLVDAAGVVAHRADVDDVDDVDDPQRDVGRRRGFGRRLLLELEPAIDVRRRRRSIGGWAPLGDGAAATGALVLVGRGGGIFAAKAGAAGTALGRGLEVGRSRELGGGARVTRVSRRQSARPAPALPRTLAWRLVTRQLLLQIYPLSIIYIRKHCI